MAKIRITGDTSEIKKSILDLSKDVKEIGKSKVAIFDKTQRDFLTKEASLHMKQLNTDMAANGKQILLNTKLQNKQGRSLKEQARTRERLLKLMQKQVGFQKEMQKIESLQAQPGKKGGIFGRMMDRVPGGGGCRGNAQTRGHWSTARSRRVRGR